VEEHVVVVAGLRVAGDECRRLRRGIAEHLKLHVAIQRGSGAVVVAVDVHFIVEIAAPHPRHDQRVRAFHSVTEEIAIGVLGHERDHQSFSTRKAGRKVAAARGRREGGGSRPDRSRRCGEQCGDGEFAARNHARK
jgi:hypothetical protein